MNIKAEVKGLHEDIDQMTGQMRREIYTQIWDRVSAGQGRVREAIENVGGTVHSQVAVTNSIGAEVPANAVIQIAGLPDVRSIEIARKGIPEISQSVPTTLVSSQWAAGYDGGPYDIGIVEWSVAEHPNLRSIASGQLIRKRPELQPAGGHGTLKGVSFGLDKIFDAWIGNPDPQISEEPADAMEWAVTYSPDSADVLNLSIG